MRFWATLITGLLGSASIVAEPLPGGSQAWAENARAAEVNPQKNNRSESPTRLSARIDKIVSRAMSENGVPGYSLVVIKDGLVLHKKGYGFADQAKKIPVTPKTVFGLASITKTFTAMAVLSLVESGKLNLDDTLAKHLSDLPESWKKITIRQLITMTSGIPTGIPRERAWPEEMAIIQRQPLMFTPGSRYCYSNPNYRALGTIIETVTGEGYLHFIRGLILRPLKMTNTGTREELAATGLITAPLSTDQRTGNLVRHNYKSTEISFSSGMLFSNAEDMAKYAQALLDRKILQSSSYKTMLQNRPKNPPGATNWAFGWNCTRSKVYQGKLTCGMKGGNPGVASSILLFPDDDIAIIGLSNAYAPGVYKIPRAVALELLGASAAKSQQQNDQVPELSF